MYHRSHVSSLCIVSHQEQIHYPSESRPDPYPGHSHHWIMSSCLKCQCNVLLLLEPRGKANMEFVAKMDASSSNLFILALSYELEELAFALLSTFPKGYNCRMIIG